MTQIKQLNPTIGDIGGTDLFVPARLANGQIGFFGGDTGGGNRPWGPPKPFPNWRSPVMVRSDTHDPAAPIEFSSAARGGGRLIDYVQDNDEFSTVLPCDAITIGNTTYLWVMFTKGLGHEKWCEILTTTDLGETWRRGDRRISVADHRGMRVMVTWERGGDGYVYIYSTGGLARDKNMIQWRVREDRLVEVQEWEPWGFSSGKWGYGRSGPADVLPRGTKCGELSLRRIQNHVLLAYFSDPRSSTTPYTITVKVGTSFETDWHRAPTYTPVRGAGIGGDILPQLYGGYIHPDSTLDRLCLIVSQWMTANGGDPYRAIQYLTRVEPLVDVRDNDEANWETVLRELRA